MSADKLDSITAFPKFFNQSSYTKLASYRRAIFQALEVRADISLCSLFYNTYRQLLPMGQLDTTIQFTTSLVHLIEDDYRNLHLLFWNLGGFTCTFWGLYVFMCEIKWANTHLESLEFPRGSLIISLWIVPPNKLNKSVQVQTCTRTTGLVVLYLLSLPLSPCCCTPPFRSLYTMINICNLSPFPRKG